MSLFLRMKDFEWAAAARYIEYVESSAGLKAMDTGKVLSFRVDTSLSSSDMVSALVKLKKSKERQEFIASTNLQLLEVWVNLRKEDGVEFESNELVVLRSYHGQIQELKAAIKSQIERCDTLMNIYKNSENIFEPKDDEDQKGNEEDEIPF